MKKLLITSILTLSSIAVSNATLILNGDFEALGGFTEALETGTPYWQWDGLNNPPARETTANYPSTVAIARSSPTDPRGAIFQTTAETIQLGTAYSMTAVAFNTFNNSGGTIHARLYYMDGATRTYIPGAEDIYTGLVNTESLNPGSMQIDYTGAGAAVDKALGVEFQWTGATGNGSWQALDNVEININTIPEPSSAALLGLGGLGLMLRRRK